MGCCSFPGCPLLTTTPSTLTAHQKIKMLVTLRPSVAARSALKQAARAMSTQAEPLVLTKRSDSGKVEIIQLNRPKALNALSSPLFNELNAAMEKADNDPEVRAIVLTGGDKVFAAGADIKEMKDKECA